MDTTRLQSRFDASRAIGRMLSLWAKCAETRRRENGIQEIVLYIIFICIYIYIESINYTYIYILYICIFI